MSHIALVNSGINCVSSHISLRGKCNNADTSWGSTISQGLQNFDLCSKLMWLLG